MNTPALSALLRSAIGDERKYRRFVRYLERRDVESELLWWQIQVLEALEKAHGFSLPRNGRDLRRLLPSIPLPESLDECDVPHWIEIAHLGGSCPVQGQGTVGAWRWFFHARHEHWSLSAALGPHVDPVDVDDNSDTTFYVEEEYGDFTDEAGYMPLGEVRYVLVRELTGLHERT